MNPVVFDAIKALLAQNKTPTVAMTKAMLKEPVPMPMIIAAVSQYKNNPEAFKNMVIEPQLPNNEQKSTQLDRIEEKLDKLLALLENSK
ncbi:MULTISPECIES: hypothetical protein [Pseudoalteromonas]|uniref:Uncharacterized protein n=1 Tax=Pseudoalteromonas ruthenica TaxID=151081 RepID=A0A0F4PPF8_9GAMM|nr:MULTISPECIES: hypothetical protein [Pseudoalteromonas]KJY95282.1 hypothetical protein TW76_15955 [Pseudoalteromonas ruthenica]KJY96126.1 hypothetical protein TW72_17400 [Pseudoalteromonas ruthenica]MCF2861229.1 hypothetical protein [Pseudoalteromonas sp. CNAT2-18]MCG7557732.1 hypothetical protein [Pseudoalteromonas sp. CNAT2-18.1]MCG7565329.1 hypothetical protein [Pseudoalteromonas sp. CnMc7-15]